MVVTKCDSGTQLSSFMSDPYFRTITTTVDTEDVTIGLLDDDIEDDVDDCQDDKQGHAIVDETLSCVSSSISSATMLSPASSNAAVLSDGLKICYVVEPSPLTYFCGYGTMFQPLFSYALDNEQSNESIVLVTSECRVPQPVKWSPSVSVVEEEKDMQEEVRVQYREQPDEQDSSKAAAASLRVPGANASTSTLVSTPVIIPLSRSSSFCSDSCSSSSSASSSSTVLSSDSSSSICNSSTGPCTADGVAAVTIVSTGNRKREMSVHHTYGIPVVLYPTATMAIDFTMKLGRILFQCKPDMVHTVTPCMFDFPNIFFCRLLNIPLLFSYHTHVPLIPTYYLNKEKWESKKSSPIAWIVLAIIQILQWMAWMYLRIIHYFADSMIVVSTEIQQEFKARGMETDVWQKGIDTFTFNPSHYCSTMRQRMTNDRADNPFIIIHSGRLALEKRIHLLKDIMDKLPNDVHLCLVGSGPDEHRIRNFFATDLDRVTFTGYLSGTDLSQAMASADTFIMQSDSETLGLVVLESLASCVPVIGVDALGVSGSIQHGKTGYLCDNTSTKILVDSIVQHVLHLKNNYEFRMQMGIAGRADMLQWSWTASCAKLRKDQYSKCITNHSQRLDVKLRQLLFSLLVLASTSYRQIVSSGQGKEHQ
jgi:sulfoquinovosyltransferase